MIRFLTVALIIWALTATAFSGLVIKEAAFCNGQLNIIGQVISPPQIQK